MKLIILFLITFCCFTFAGKEEEKSDWSIEDLLGSEVGEVMENAGSIPVGVGLDKVSKEVKTSLKDAGESLIRTSEISRATFSTKVTSTQVSNQIQKSSIKNMSNKVLYKAGKGVSKISGFAGKAVGVLGAGALAGAFTAISGGSRAEIISSVATSIIADVIAMAIIKGILFAMSFSITCTAWLNGIPIIGTIIWVIEVIIAIAISTALMAAASAIISSTMGEDEDVLGMEDER